MESMIFHMELCQNREEMNDADSRRTRSLSRENEVFASNNEQDGKSPIANQESVEYTSDSSCEGYKEFHKQQDEKRNLSPISTSAFTIDSILGRSEKRDQLSKMASSGDREENQDETAERIKGHFITSSAIPAARPGT